MDHEYDIKYDFYPIQCANLMSVDNIHGKFIQANYLGKLIQPNIVLAKTNVPYTTYYQSSKLYLAGSSNVSPSSTASLPSHDGQIILEHKPSTTDKTLFVVFLLKYHSSTGANYFPIQKLLGLENVPLEFNKYIPKEKLSDIKVISPPMEDRVYVIFQDVIPIDINITGKFTDFFQKDQVQSIQIDILQKDVDMKKLPHPNQQALQEGFQEGLDQNLTCELIDVPSDDMVQVLQVPVGSLGYNDMVSRGFGDVFLNQLFVFFVSIIIFLIGPLAYVWLRNLLGNMLGADGANLFVVVQKWSNGKLFSKLDFFGDHPSLYEIIWFCFLVLSSISSILIGFATDNLTAKVSGFFGIYLYFFMYLGIKFYYATHPDEGKHMRGDTSDPPYPFPPPKPIEPKT